MIRRRTFIASSASALALPAFAQGTFPSKVVRIVVPFPAGGGIDVMIRAIGQELSQKWGQPVVIENKAGAGSLIGADYVARQPADGHTLLATVNQTFTSNRYLYKTLPYDPDKSFVPIIEMVESEQFILASSAVPAKDLKEFVALAKKDPVKYPYGSFGPGTQPHLAFATLAKRENIDLTHVPYKGIAPLMTALAAGEVAVSTGSGSVAGALMQAGKMKPLAITSKQRSPLYPNVPTAQEQGYGYLNASIWYGLFAPAGTPQAVVDKINADVRALLRDPAFAEKNATSRNLTVVAGTPQQFAAVIREETAVVAEMIRAADVKPE
ncbi:Bug family tripartite tricarboxylate transporter substrate binding protein [Ramlibacter albus]|uniref:Tripartite tricarboxylate transporter substrate binding protein n=1 Tax=Ramlibacter albus TaxID=2079448 RepID=A0A923MAN1_9BURK|nr:tripartite tricarboxylate transporter substrate binding protein [Ramlibacter albus]MBC5765834.1 tripartite tricarboxylate transporter substrate binding protein [Ramlibacter albus]